MITLLNHYGQPVHLNQVANIYYGKGPSEIQRKDRERLVTVAANLSGEVSLGQVTAAVEKAVEKHGAASRYPVSSTAATRRTCATCSAT